MSEFFIGFVVSNLLWVLLNLCLHDVEVNYGKNLIYEHSCKVKCGVDYLTLEDDNKLCVCKNGITYKRDLNNLYK